VLRAATGGRARDGRAERSAAWMKICAALF
jgi:hypothetical protein